MTTHRLRLLVPQQWKAGFSDLLWVAIVAAAYVAAAEMGFAFAFATKQVTAIWPPTGIALAAFLLRGTKIWPGVFLGAFVSNAISDEPVYTATGIAVGNTLGPLFGAYLLRRFVGIDTSLSRLKDVLGLAIFGSALAMTVTATNGVMNLALGGLIPWAAAPSVWWVWWVGDSVGALLIGSTLLTWYANPRLLWPRSRILELVAAFAALMLVSALSFSESLPLAYPVFTVVIWVALRFEQRETAIAVLIISILSVWRTTHGRGPFVVLGSLDQSLGLQAMFVSVLAITALALGSLATQRRRAEASLRRANEELEGHTAELARQSNAKSDFLSSMSHELRTPLNAILGFGQMLDLDFEHTLTATQKEYCKYILTSGNHLLDLVNEVLDLAGIESSHLKLSMEAVNVRYALEDVYATMAPLAMNADVTLVISVPEAIAEIHADALRLRQVLINLVSNAIKYNRPNGGVTLSALQLPTGGIRLVVIDTGIGIATEQQKQLFEPFQRLGAEYTNVEGTGIGLAISRRLVEAMHGSIGLISEAGRGSTFWIELPTATNTASPKISGTLSNASTPRTQASATYSLLYIEDNPTNLRLMEHLLSTLPNVTMLSAPTPQLGLDMAVAHRPDVIVLDLSLPVMSGFEVLARLQGMPETRNIPVLALTAAALPRDISRGLAAGFFSYLTKPLDVNAFLGAVDNALAFTVSIASATG